MEYKYITRSHNGDATTNYNIEGKFPVKFIDFFEWIIKNTTSFRIEFRATNECYGGWAGNLIEVHKNTETGDWHIENQEPNNLYERIKDLEIVKCFANGGWGQITYFVTFAEGNANCKGEQE